MKRRVLAALWALALVLGLAVTANAAVDPNRTGSISLTMTSNGKPVPGGTVSLFRVADLTEVDGTYQFTYTHAFKDCAVSLEGDLTSESTAHGIELHIAAHSSTILPLETRTVDKNGKVAFSNLPVGLYLLVQYEAAPGYSTMGSFLISVPREVNGVYDYSVDATPKMGLIVPEKPTEPTPPPSTIPSDKLTQTGQLNWPVPVMASSGLLLFAIGWFLSGRRKDYEG